MSTVQEKIDGLIALMQRGVYEGERTQAHKALVRLCAKHNINLEDVIRRKEEPDIYLVPMKNREEGEIFAQAAFRYAEPVFIGWYRLKRCTMAVECLPMKYLELMAAWSVLKRSYREEKKVFMHAFFQRNRLFSERPNDAPEPTPEELERSLRASIMARGMNAAEIHKQLSAPSPS